MSSEIVHIYHEEEKFPWSQQSIGRAKACSREISTFIILGMKPFSSHLKWKRKNRCIK